MSGRRGKRVDEHYRSAEHRAWRDEVLRRAGWACQSCGGCHTAKTYQAAARRRLMDRVASMRAAR